jgi:hypothetical protein
MILVVILLISCIEIVVSKNKQDFNEDLIGAGKSDYELISK